MNRKHFLRILSAALLPALLSACAAQRPELYALRNGGSHQPFYFTDRYGELAFREFYDWAGQFVGDRAVVDNCHNRRSHPLPDLICENACAFADEVGFQAMPDGFVDQHSGPAVAQYDGNTSGRRRTGI